MRGLSVNRAARRRKETREIRRSRATRRRRADAQTTGRKPSKDRLLASVQLLGRKFRGLASRRRVDERKKPFVAARRGIVGAILRADIDCRRYRQAATGEDIVEFGAVIVGEKNIVMNERRAFGVRPHRQRQRRQRGLGARRGAGGANGVLRLTPEQTVAQRRDVAVHDDGVGLDCLAVGEPDAVRATGLHQDFLRVATVKKSRPARLRQTGEGAGEAVHAARQSPDAIHLDMRDEHERRRRGEGRGAAIGRIAPKKLTQARIAKILAEFVPHRCERRYAQQLRQAGDAGVTHQIDRTGPLGQNERLAQTFVDRSRARAKTQEARRFGRARKGADRIGALVGIGEEIELRAIPPQVSRQRLRALQADMVGERRAGFGENLFENPAHGEDGRAGVEQQPARFDLTHLSARPGGAFDHRHVDAFGRQQQGGDKSADAGADHDDALPVQLTVHERPPSGSRDPLTREAATSGNIDSRDKYVNLA